MKDAIYLLKKERSARVGLIIITIVIMLGLLAPIIAPYDPVTADGRASRLAPCAEHLFGTDSNGMDIFSRCIYAIRIDVVIGVVGTMLSLLIGIPLGLVAGYYEGFIGELILRLADLLQAFPAFILAMALVAATGQDVKNIIYVIAFLNSPIYIRYVRAEVISLKQRSYIEACHAAGMSDVNIMFRQLLPNSLRPAMIQASINIGGAILLTAGLSFIGAGVPVPTPEWGSMISTGANMIITGQWWAAFFPGISIGITVLGFALTADFIRLYLNPERK